MRSEAIRLANGLQLHYVQRGDIDGDVAVFLHGWPDSWYSFSPVLKLLTPTIWAIAPDLPGFGDSDRPEKGYEIKDFAASVVALLDALSIRRTTLIGHSMGSFVARHIAMSQPERVEGLVLIASGLSASSPVLRDAREVVANLTDPLPEEFVRDFQAGSAYLPVPERFFQGVVDESLKAPARVWQRAIDGLLRYEDSDSLARISAPTLLLWGEHDAVFEGEKDQKRLAAAIPDAELRIYAGTGHCPNWERPELVANAISDFMHAKVAGRAPV